MTRPRILLFTILALFALPTIAAENRWSIKGPDGGTVNRIVFDPVNPSIVYAGTSNGVFRSSDGGQHWTGPAELLGTSINDIAVANSDPQKVFASTTFGLYKSKDRGLTWSVVHPFGSYAVAVSRTNADIVYSDSTSGPFRSSDGGVTFAAVGSGLPPAPSAVSVLVTDPENPDIVYAAYQTNVGVYKSADGGAHWTAANIGLPQTVFYSLAIDPSNGSTLYAGGAPGLFKTTDGGGSWAALAGGLPASFFAYSLSISAGSPSTILAGLNSGLYKSTNGGTSWTGPLGFNGSTVNPAAIDPVNPADILVTSYLITLRSTNGGTSFSNTSGLNAFYTTAIAVDPRNDSIVYATGSGGLSKSIDHGENWTSLTTTSTTSVAVDAQSSQIVYANPNGAVRRSIDSGATWTDFSTGLPAGASQLLVADPQAAGTIYTILGNAVYKKVGTNPWTKTSTGLATGSINFITIDASNSATLYAGGGIGLYKSIDGGATWAALGGSGSQTVVPAGLIIDPFDSRHVLSWANSSAFESIDGGSSGSPFAIPAGRQAITLAFDASAPGRIYCSGSDNTGAAAIDRSNDGGKTWFPLSSGLGRSNSNVFVAAPGGNILYAGSKNAGVWVLHFAKGRAVAK